MQFSSKKRKGVAGGGKCVIVRMKREERTIGIQTDDCGIDGEDEGVSRCAERQEFGVRSRRSGDGGDFGILHEEDQVQGGCPGHVPQKRASSGVSSTRSAIA